MAREDVSKLDRGQLLARLGESGIPFDAACSTDQLRATVSRLPLLLEEANRRALAEAGADVVPVSVDPGPDPETGYVKQRGEVGTSSETSTVQVTVPNRVNPAQQAELEAAGEWRGQPEGRTVSSSQAAQALDPTRPAPTSSTSSTKAK